jgi:upstream-binding transcription factor
LHQINHKPKKPATSYIRYAVETRASVVAECKDVPSKELNKVVTKKLSEKWAKMSDKEKKPFVERAKKENEEYLKKMSDYKEKTKQPKKPSSNFFMFTGQRRKEFLKKVSHIESKQKQNIEVSKLLGQEWKKMTEEQKKPYTLLAEKDKERYIKEVAAYKEKQESLSHD